MTRRYAITAGLTAIVALTLAACGETKSETAEVTTCKKIAQLALHNPETLDFVNSRVEELSEGDEIYLEVEYKSGDTAGHIWDKCWFAGYGEEKRLKSFSVRESQTAEYTEIPEEEFTAIQQQMAN